MTYMFTVTIGKAS